MQFADKILYESRILEFFFPFRVCIDSLLYVKGLRPIGYEYSLWNCRDNATRRLILLKLLIQGLGVCICVDLVSFFFLLSFFLLSFRVGRTVPSRESVYVYAAAPFSDPGVSRIYVCGVVSFSFRSQILVRPLRRRPPSFFKYKRLYWVEFSFFTFGELYFLPLASPEFCGGLELNFFIFIKKIFRIREIEFGFGLFYTGSYRIYNR